MSSVHTAPEKMQQSLGILDLCLRKTGSEKSRDYCDVIVFEKRSSQNVFSPHGSSNLAFSNFSGLTGVFETFHLNNMSRNAG